MRLELSLPTVGALQHFGMSGIYESGLVIAWANVSGDGTVYPLDDCLKPVSDTL